MDDFSQLCTDHVVTCVQVTGDFGKEWPLGCARGFQREGTILLPVAPMENSWCFFLGEGRGCETFEMKINGKGIGPSPVYHGSLFSNVTPKIRADKPWNGSFDLHSVVFFPVGRICVCFFLLWESVSS